MTWERARSEEQIEERINEILNATERLYEEHRFEKITFVMIAKEAGFTRSNLYRYFKTKEDIFLKLLALDITIWRKDAEKTFTEEEKDIIDFSKRWVVLWLKHKRMLEIYTILYTLLEKNASLEALVDFKKSIFADMGFSIEVISKILPFMIADKAMEFMYASLSLVTGVYPLMDLTPKQKEAMQIVGMEMSPEMVVSMLESSTLSLLKGLSS
ncbi:MAG: TetR family transcriptional regulator [Anaerolineae bacterium]|jgi:AcrR family transcriptional regulator|nr:TetR family transcriptional regulator [Anaerolineae bacterium]MBT7989800.1 TetR family transcriptional regulator [Anaerolineae bacterium]